MVTSAVMSAQPSLSVRFTVTVTENVSVPGPLDKRMLRWEIVCVFAVSLGASGLYALVSYIGSLTANQSLSSQTAVLNGSLAPGRPLLDLFLQLTNISLALAPVMLVFYLLARAGDGPRTIGLDTRRPW